MTEIFEFRIPEDDAARHLPAAAGVLLGETARKVVVAPDEPLFELIGRLQHKFRARRSGSGFFVSWHVERCYLRTELEEAELLHVWPKKTFEPAGEECGTIYDDTEACDHVFARTPEADICGHRIPASVDICGVGAQQVTPLFLDVRRIPRTVDLARTIAGEVIVSQRAAEVFIESNLTGFELDPIRHKAQYKDDPIDLEKLPTGMEILRKAGAEGVEHRSWAFGVWLNRTENRSMLKEAQKEHTTNMVKRAARRPLQYPAWYQLKVTSDPVEISLSTRAGGDPFDEKGYGRCPRGHIVGLNLLSEIAVIRATVPKADVIATRQMVGVRRGLLRPRPRLLLSHRAWRAIDDANLKGLVVEVAHLT